MSLTPKNWGEFQHYKDRSPAWIKLHRGLLDDFAFSRLPVASRALAPMLWLLASEYEDGKIAASIEEIAFRLRMSTDELRACLKPLLDGGFFIDDSALLATCKQVAIPEREKEEELEREEETDIRAVAVATRPAAKVPFEEFWEAYPKRDGANPKEPAKKKFMALVRSGADPKTIIGGAARYRAEMREKGQERTPYVAQAMTWLNQQRFNDYATSEAPETITGPPPGAPSDAELRAKYRGMIADEQQGPAGPMEGDSGGDQEPQGSGILREVSRDSQPAGPSGFRDRAGHGGIRSLGQILPAIGLDPRSLSDRDFREGNGEDPAKDDRPDPMAGMVHQ